MKTNSHQVKAVRNGWHKAAVLFAFLGLVAIGATLGFAQIKSQKRVTALQMGDSAEGARVTIVSDSALNDYEAFRRGDRFYVKIPLAEFSAATPNFKGNGFEDVRVQTVGDSVIVSFKLQPGATARVDQRSNRLDVIFSAVGTVRNVAPVNVAKSYPTSRNRRNTTDSEAAAGPVPPMTSTPVRESRDYTELSSETGSGSYRQGARPSRSNRRDTTSAARGNERSVTSGNPASQKKSGVPASTPSPATMPTPYSTSTAATALATPAATATYNPYGVPVSGTSKIAETSGWDSRIKFLKAWAKLNRSALIIGGLIALALLIGFVVWSRRKGPVTETAKTKRKDVKKPATEKVAGRTVVEGPASAAPVAKPSIPSTPVARPEVWTPQPAAAGFATAGMRDSREADQDREVFEL